jgi:hypothetical protein
MPQIFKALVSISVWILFVWGCVLLINSMVLMIIGWADWQPTMAGFGIAVVSLALAAVAAMIRQKLE